MNDGHDARHKRLAERLSYLRARIAYPERRTEKLRLEALEADVLLILEHLTGQHPEAADSPASSAMPGAVETQ